MSENTQKKDTDSRQKVSLDPEDKNQIHVIQSIVVLRGGTKPSNAQVVADALACYLSVLRGDSEFTFENARIGARIRAALKKAKASPDAHMSGFIAGNIELLLRLANEENTE